MAEGWHYFATTLHGDGTETLAQTDLPLTDVEITRTLSSVDELTATVPVEVGRLKGAEYSLFVPWQTAVYAELGGVIRGAGIVTSTDVDDQSVQVHCDGFRGYLTGLPWTGKRKTYTQQDDHSQGDSLTIARDIWEWVQTRARGNLGLEINCDPAKSGVRLGTKKKDVKFKTSQGEDVEFEAGPWKINWWDTLDIGERWDDLAKDGKFDYWEEHRWSGENIRHILHVNSPTAGRRRTDLRFVVGENVESIPAVEVDGTEYADVVIVLGAGEGSKMVRSPMSGTGTKRLHRPVVVTDKTIRSNAAATRRAQSLAGKYIGDRDVTQVTVRDHPNAPIGSWGLGDVIQVQGSGDGWSGGLNMSLRITGYTLHPDEGDVATLQVSRPGRVSNDG